MMHIKKLIYSLIIPTFILSQTSCEETFVPDTSVSQQEIVVEGYVEAGKDANPVFVILTRSIPFISTIEPDKFSELFVKNAKITVFDGDKTVELNEICLSQIPDELKEEVYAVLGLNPDSTAADICVYADLFEKITREYGRKYDLKVMVDDKILTATTSIPQPIGLSGFKWSDPPGAPNDTLAQLNVTINDPVAEKNFYRYFTATGKDRQFIPPFGSVTDDAIFNGKEFEFPLQKAQRRGGDFDPVTFGLYERGDSVFVKWCAIDKAHFEFWNTRDFSANSGGPFSSYTRISSNVTGGLGIWGGYAIESYSLYPPPK
ncbi:MAG: DUF4249 domain-containing protein [Saprospiraceae bacterium]|nr:DUF4249 domain-containing protein [Saprospiraceae bacterium]